jgi:hypothetical protein
MLMLPELLRGLSAAVFDGPAGAGRDPGLEVYRRNLRANFAKVLALEFPAVARLLGDERFAAVAAEYQRTEPSRGGNLHDIGARFATHLGQRLEPASLRWIADVAALEWAWEEAAVAADATTRIDPRVLAALPPDRLWTLRLAPHPALRIVRSVYPVHAIWRANLPDATGRIAALEPQFRLALDQGGESVVIERPAVQVEVVCVADAEAAWLEAIAQGNPLGAALEAALACDAGFDLTAALAQVLARQRVVEIVG